jgi:hypothetical protein
MPIVKTPYPCTKCSCPEYWGEASGLCSNTSENGTICAHGAESHGASESDRKDNASSE